MVRSMTPAASRAVTTLGLLIAAERREQRRPQADLAARAGVSVATLAKIERGDPGVAVGSVLEVAALLGIELFPDVDDTSLERWVALVPARIRRQRSDPTERRGDF